MYSLLLLTTILVTQPRDIIHTVKIPFEISSREEISVKGEVSNSLDPCLSSPRSFEGFSHLGNTFSLPLKEKCYIKVRALLSSTQEVTFIIRHDHDIYDEYIDLIGYLDYQIKDFRWRIKLSHRTHHEYVKPLMDFEKFERFLYSGPPPVYMVRDNIDHTWRETLNVFKVIPGHRYKLEFEYVIGRGSQVINKYQVNIRSFQDTANSYLFGDSQKFKLKYNGRWNKFSQVIKVPPSKEYIDIANYGIIQLKHKVPMNRLEISFDIKSEDLDYVGAIFIRNGWLTPLTKSNY